MGRAVAAAMLLATTATGVLSEVAKDKVDALPGWSKPLPSDQYSGYLDAGAGKHLHYWLVESESPTAKTDPVTPDPEPCLPRTCCSAALCRSLCTR